MSEYSDLTSCIFNFLGIILDEHMTWNKYISKVACKTSRMIFTLTKLKRFLLQSILKHYITL